MSRSRTGWIRGIFSSVASAVGLGEESNPNDWRRNLSSSAVTMGCGAGSSALISNIIRAESREIRYRALKATVMLGIGYFLINCAKSAISKNHAENICQSLCTSLEITRNPRDVLDFAQRLFSGETTPRKLDSLIGSAARLVNERVPEGKKPELHFAFGTATLTLRFLSLLAKDSASMLLGYTILHGLGLNYYSKELGASFKQTLFTTVLAAGVELASEQISQRMRK